MPRGRPGESRYIKKIRRVITFSEFEDLIKNLESLIEKSLLAFLYYIGLRPAEVVGDGPRKWKVLTHKGRQLQRNDNLPKGWIKSDESLGLWEWKHRGPVPGILKEDITLDGNILRIVSQPLKHGKREGPGGEGPGELELDINYKYANLIVEQWRKTEPEHKIWDISTSDAWNTISKASGGKFYPHAFRLSRATKLGRTEGITISDMKQWFGWARASTADSYIAPAESVKKVRELIGKEVPE